MKIKKARIKEILKGAPDEETEDERLLELQREKMARREERAKERKQTSQKKNTTDNKDTHPGPAPVLLFESLPTQEPLRADQGKNNKDAQRMGRGKHTKNQQQETMKKEGGNPKQKQAQTVRLKEGQYIHIVNADRGLLRTEEGPQVVSLLASETLMPCCLDGPHISFLCSLSPSPEPSCCPFSIPTSPSSSIDSFIATQHVNPDFYW